MDAVLTAVSTVGFPIACALGMGWFIYKIYLNTTEQHKQDMAQVQARCAEREEKLYDYIDKAQEINGQAIATISLYVERLDVIQADVKEIKERLQ